MKQPIVIGIDGGGTVTRVMAADLTGRVVGYREGGSARLDRHPDATQNVQSTIAMVLNDCQCTPEEVRMLVAGIAGLDSHADEAWAAKLTNLERMDCQRVHVNDAVIAHAGALRSRPGIIVISGTGSVVFAVTENNRLIRNYDMQHYANSGARHLAFAAIFKVLAAEHTDEDESLVHQMLQHFNAEDVGALRQLMTNDNQGFTQDLWPMVGQIAPLITESAAKGIPLAQQVCNHACQELATGIRLLGGHFHQDEVLVSFIGSVIRSRYMHQRTAELLENRLGAKTFQVMDPAMDSTKGAVLLALEKAGVESNQGVIDNLLQSETRLPTK